MRTPLFDSHLAAGGRMVDFAGWDMPVQYSGILAEHKAVREEAGVFDISHMGEFFVSGPGSAAWLDSLLTNRVAALSDGQAQYSLMLNELGGVIDDLIVYRLGADNFLLVVNASMIDEDAAWMKERIMDGVEFKNASADFAALAIQGPLAGGIFERLFGRKMPAERNRVLQIGDDYVVTTGYTGEAGFEWIVPAGEAAAAWLRSLAAGAKPCGLGARDTLRLEVCYPLNGSDLAPDRTPLEAGLGFFVDFEKPDFVGKAALVAQKAAGVPSRLCALRVTEKTPPIRPHYPVWVGGKPVTETTSGALSPSLGDGIALAYLPSEFSKPGQEVEIEVRGRRFRACVRKKPLYQKET
ncbi:MAG: glycine cleavage system aminomethyltransferase GcvT [Verrucomicrobia bacterium]|nr:glycine cleavage system aminomethyltransferase GcvT [Verrucomicrobiota bacterium]